jgi:hypothetical protein
VLSAQCREFMVNGDENWRVESSDSRAAAQAVEQAEVALGRLIDLFEEQAQALYGSANPATQKAMAGLHSRWLVDQQKLLSALHAIHAALPASRDDRNAHLEDRPGARFGYLREEL